MNKKNVFLSGAIALVFLTPARSLAQTDAPASSTTTAPSHSQRLRNVFKKASILTGAPENHEVPASVVPTTAPGPKKAGSLRIGIALPLSDGTASREELRSEWAKLFTGPNLEPVNINAGLPEQALAEAKTAECDYVVFSTLSQKIDNSRARKLTMLRAATTMVPMVGMASGMAGIIAATAAQSAGTASLGSLVKAKQEISLQYKLVSSGTSQTLLENTEAAKAAQDGQDIITPLATQAAKAMFSWIQSVTPTLAQPSLGTTGEAVKERL